MNVPYVRLKSRCLQGPSRFNRAPTDLTQSSPNIVLTGELGSGDGDENEKGGKAKRVGTHHFFIKVRQRTEKRGLWLRTPIKGLMTERARHIIRKIRSQEPEGRSGKREFGGWLMTRKNPPKNYRSEVGNDRALGDRNIRRQLFN